MPKCLPPGQPPFIITYANLAHSKKKRAAPINHLHPGSGQLFRIALTYTRQMSRAVPLGRKLQPFHLRGASYYITLFIIPIVIFAHCSLAFMVDHKITAHHKPHDGRKHFITLAKKYNVDEYAIKRIVGHSIKSDLTEFVYTERDNNWLYSEICKIQEY